MYAHVQCIYVYVLYFSISLPCLWALQLHGNTGTTMHRPASAKYAIICACCLYGHFHVPYLQETMRKSTLCMGSMHNAARQYFFAAIWLLSSD